MPVPIWAGRYIGIDFKEHGRDRAGLDCWGLARLVLAEQFSIALPSFSTDYRRTSDPVSVAAVIEREWPKWTTITAGAECAGDLVVFRVRGLPMHVGIVLGDKTMLHVERGINSAIERYSGAQWKDRIYGFCRYDTPAPSFRSDHDFRDSITRY